MIFYKQTKQKQIGPIVLWKSQGNILKCFSSQFFREKGKGEHLFFEATNTKNMIFMYHVSKILIALVWVAFWNLGKIWKSNHIPIQLKLNIFRASSVFQYYCTAVKHGCLLRSWKITSTAVPPTTVTTTE